MSRYHELRVCSRISTQNYVLQHLEPQQIQPREASVERRQEALEETGSLNQLLKIPLIRTAQKNSMRDWASPVSHTDPNGMPKRPRKQTSFKGRLEAWNPACFA